MVLVTNVADRVARVKADIETACRRVGRAPAEVTLVAVAKTFPADAIKAAVEAGIGDIGENRAQELKQKAQVLASSPIRWHFVGPLQTNKVRQVVGIAALIHSVDRIGLAEAIARRAAALRITQDVLIEVNLAGEASKAGMEPASVIAFASEVAELERLAVRGLMAIPPQTLDPDEARSHFKDLVSLRDRVAERVPGATELSMGMTHDHLVAIEEGATIVRVGTAIFGPRNP